MGDSMLFIQPQVISVYFIYLTAQVQVRFFFLYEAFVDPTSPNIFLSSEYLALFL